MRADVLQPLHPAARILQIAPDGDRAVVREQERLVRRPERADDLHGLPRFRAFGTERPERDPTETAASARNESGISTAPATAKPVAIGGWA